MWLQFILYVVVTQVEENISCLSQKHIKYKLVKDPPLFGGSIKQGLCLINMYKDIKTWLIPCVGSFIIGEFVLYQMPNYTYWCPLSVSSFWHPCGPWIRWKQQYHRHSGHHSRCFAVGACELPSASILHNSTQEKVFVTFDSGGKFFRVMTSGFCHSVNEIFALLRCYTV